MCLSCGSTPSGSTRTSGLKYRAFITNKVSAGTASAGVYIVNAETDVRANAVPISAGQTPGMMVVTPNRAQTLVFSGDGTQFSDNQFTIINNASESPSGQVSLHGMTESFVVSPDSSTAYVAVPTAQVTGQSSGVVQVISLSSGAITAPISCPPLNPNPPNPPPPPVCVTAGQGDQGINLPYRFLSIGNTGNRVLAFSEGSDSVANTVAVITPSSIGTAKPVVTFVPGFDHPVSAFFSSDDTTAYVLNCGAECGGKQASVQTLDLTTNTPGPPVVVCTPGGNPQCVGTLDLVAGSVGVVEGSTMYVAGTPVPPQSCPAGTTAAPACGLLTVVDLPTMTVTNSGISITDGYHNRMALGANGQLFIGASTCSEISTAAETRGCLSIYNTLKTAVGSVPPGAVLIPPVNGDVTGIQPIATRSVVYVIQGQGVSQGGTLYIYDATIDALYANPNDPNNPGQIFGLVGSFVDVRTVDF